MLNLKAIGAAALIVGGLGAFSSANAAPAAPQAGLTADGLVTHVAQGCGPGFHRGPGGFCRPNFGPRPGFRPRPFYGPRCFVRPTPWGPRRVCR